MCGSVDEAEEAGGFRVVDLNYVSLYLEDLDRGVEFYGELFGPPVYEEGRLRGWRMGATWLTLFPSDAGSCAGENPRNAEYAIQVERPGQYRRSTMIHPTPGYTEGFIRPFRLHDLSDFVEDARVPSDGTPGFRERDEVFFR